MSIVIRLGFLTLEAFLRRQRNALKLRGSYLSFFRELVEIGYFSKMGFISLERRFYSIDVDPSFFPNSFHTLVVGGGNIFVDGSRVFPVTMISVVGINI